MKDFMVLLGETTVVIFFIVFFIRIMGKNHLKETSPLDFIYLLLIGSIGWDMILEEKYNLIHIFLTLTLVSLIIWLVDYGTHKFSFMEKIFIGKPKVLINEGIIDNDLMEKEQISQKELESMLREKGAFDISEIQLAILEINGTISVKLRKEC